MKPVWARKTRSMEPNFVRRKRNKGRSLRSKNKNSKTTLISMNRSVRMKSKTPVMKLERPKEN